MAGLQRRDREELVSFLRRHAGDNLRTVGFVREGEYEPVYVRADVRAEYGPGEVASIADVLAEEGDRARREEDLYGLGSLGCVIRCFSEGLVLHFPCGEGSSPVVSLDPGAGTRLHAFVARCRRRIEEG